MALRMLLVGVVACLGLNQPHLRGSDQLPTSEARGLPAGIVILGALADISPIHLPAERPAATTEGPAPMPGVAAASLLFDWSAALAHRDRSAREANEPDAVAAVEAREFSCIVCEVPCPEQSRIAEVEIEEPVPVEIVALPAPDPDAGFHAAVDAVVDSFAKDLQLSVALSEPAPPAPEADTLSVNPAATEPAPVVTELEISVEPEPLYPGLAYELNQDHDGIDDPRPLIASTSTVPPIESRGEQVAMAVRLTGQAIQAWARIFVQTGPVSR